MLPSGLGIINYLIAIILLQVLHPHHLQLSLCFCMQVLQHAGASAAGASAAGYCFSFSC